MAKVTVTKTNRAEAGYEQDFDSTPTLQLIIAWAVVGVPLVYGVSQVFVKSLALFQ